MNEPVTTLESLFRRYSGAVFDACVRILRNRAEAEDATQETFVLAHRNLSKVLTMPSPMGWLYRVATTVCFKTLRTARRQGVDASSSADQQVSVEPQAGDRIDAVRQLRQLASSLGERDFEIVVSHFVHGMNQGEIAEHLGISRRAVVKRLSRLRATHGLSEGADDDS